MYVHVSFHLPQNDAAAAVVMGQSVVLLFFHCIQKNIGIIVIVKSLFFSQLYY